MEIVDALVGVPTANQEVKSKSFEDLNTEDFIQLLVAQLSNQNPLEPLQNDQLLQQVTGINSLRSEQKLIETLNSLSLSQTLGSASNLIGKNVLAEVGDSKIVDGVVSRAIVENGDVLLDVDGQIVKLDQVTQIS